MQGGCIIRAAFLDRIKQAYLRDPQLPSLLVDPPFAKVRVLGQDMTAVKRIIRSILRRLDGIWCGVRVAIGPAGWGQVHSTKCHLAVSSTLPEQLVQVQGRLGQGFRRCASMRYVCASVQS